MSTQISEIGRSAAMERLFEGTPYKNEIIRPQPARGVAAQSHHFFMEGVDFDLTYTPLKHLGYKLVLAALGDLYAQCLQPERVSVILALSNRFSYEDVATLWGGMIAAMQEHKIASVALELAPSVNGLCVSVTAVGIQKRIVLERRLPMQSKDLVVLSGHLGAAYMGLHILEREKVAFQAGGAQKQPDLTAYRGILADYLSPEVKPDLLSRLIKQGIVPSAGEFITRGLACSVLDLQRRSGLGVKIYINRIPISAQTFQACEELNIDAVTAAMNGGDDFKFLFVIPNGQYDVLHKEFPDLEVVGHLAQPEVGAVLVTPESVEIPIQAPNY
ncbi:MAG: hypothetical protein IKV28_00565 [Bacteroidales bacterium]|nr:hypothetical protein [Bacteroidales bacterium]